MPNKVQSVRNKEVSAKPNERSKRLVRIEETQGSKKILY